MIISEIKGGLGNQLFQFANGLSSSIDRNQLLILDKSFYNNNYKLENTTFRNFELGKLTPKYISLDYRVNSLTTSIMFDKKLVYFKKIITNLLNLKVVNEIKYRSPKIIKDITKNIYLKGYWQSDVYFRHNKKNIVDSINFPAFNTIKLSELSKLILSVNSVAIHIRRGDYYSNLSVGKFINIPTTTYYKKAIIKIRKLVNNPYFFIFSDDINWCIENIKEIALDENVRFISPGVSPDAINDLHLMSLCKNAIIGASSFGWWGAWLQKNPSKYTIAPKKWFTAENWQSYANPGKVQGWINI